MKENGDLDELFNLLHQLGLKNASHPTMHILGLTILCVSEGPVDTKKMAPEARTHYTQAVTSAFKRFIT